MSVFACPTCRELRLVDLLTRIQGLHQPSTLARLYGKNSQGRRNAVPLRTPGATVARESHKLEIGGFNSHWCYSKGRR